MKGKIVMMCSLWLVITCSSCIKEYSCENGNCNGFKIASFDCNNYAVVGVFQKGVPLNDSSKIVVRVSVIDAGEFNITTDTVNGVYFTSSGYLSGSGNGTITLKANGIPENSGSFSFASSNLSCILIVNFEEISTPAYIYYYEATIDGQFYKETVGDSQRYEAGTAIGSNINGLNISRLTGNIAPWQPARPNATTLIISKAFLTNYDTCSNARFKGFFAPGNYPYANVLHQFAPPFTDGISIIWLDENGHRWDSDPSGNQSGAFFTIEKTEDIVPGSFYHVKVTATFSCRMIDSSGNSRNLTNGKFVGLFQKM